MRLAFAIAVNVDPDILIIDEVLGVGDQAFVEKCVDRIEQFRSAGKTMVCVSHSLELISSLCERAIWLDHGRIVKDGSCVPVVREYSATMHSHVVPEPIR